MSDDSISSRTKMILADILNVEANTIDNNTSMDNVATWDSLNHINIVFALEQEFDFSFDVDEIESILSFYDMVQIVEKKI